MHDSPPRLAFSYLRFSRTEQGRGSSLQRQIDLRQAYCQRHNLTLDDSRQYEDKGVSGFHGRNSVTGHLAEFLDLVQSGEVPPGSVLLIESLDRLSRDQIRSARDRLESILESSIEIHTLQPERIYDKNSLSDPYALIGLILEFAKAFEYSQQLSKRLSAAWDNKRQKAKDSKTPLSKSPVAWLQVADGQYQIIPERAAAIRQIYECCRDGMGVNLICKELDRRQIPPFGKKWLESYIAKILLSEAPIGHYHSHRFDPVTKKRVPSEKIENLFPPVISETLNAQAKVAMRQRKNKGGRVQFDGNIHPFSNLLQTHGGAPIHVKYHQRGRTEPKTVEAYLQDQSNRNTYPLVEFEALMLDWLCKYEPAPARKQSGSELGTLEEKLARLEHRIIKLKDRINASGGEFDSLLDLLVTAEREKKDQSQRLEQLRAIEPTSNGLLLLRGLIERVASPDEPDWMPLPIEDRLQLRAVLRRMVKQIEVTIGRENRFFPKKSVRVTVTFKDGTKKEFLHQP